MCCGGLSQRDKMLSFVVLVVVSWWCFVVVAGSVVLAGFVRGLSTLVGGKPAMHG